MVGVPYIALSAYPGLEFTTAGFKKHIFLKPAVVKMRKNSCLHNSIFLDKSQSITLRIRAVFLVYEEAAKNFISHYQKQLWWRSKVRF
jgi:hypothetical protein